MIPEHLRPTFIFFQIYLLLFFVGVSYYLFVEHGDFVLFLNEFQNGVFDLIFKISTFGGDVIFCVLVAILILVYNKKYGFVFIGGAIIVGLLSLFLKQYLFADTPRPKIYFQQTNALKFIEGVEVYDFNAFPSGHTMTAFFIATFLTLMLKNWKWSLGLIFYGFFIGLSRVYLLQHFLIDVIAGSMIGSLVAMASYFVFEDYLNNIKAQPEQEEVKDVDLSSLDMGD